MGRQSKIVVSASPTIPAEVLSLAVGKADSPLSEYQNGPSKDRNVALSCGDRENQRPF